MTSLLSSLFPVVRQITLYFLIGPITKQANNGRRDAEAGKVHMAVKWAGGGKLLRLEHERAKPVS